MFNVGDKFMYVGSADRWKGAEGVVNKVFDYGNRYDVTLTDAMGERVTGGVRLKDMEHNDPIKKQERQMWEALI